ncbi:MAG: NUDIX domain-containing protein [bacterium]|nr:NUDIX domain-containing protein [bacterium]
MKRFFINMFWNTINPFRRLYWFIFKPRTRGVKVLVVWERKILLVRLGYAHLEWTIPGGGVHRGESYEEAARREIKEEVGIVLDGIKKIGEYESRKEHKRDTVVCFRATVQNPIFHVDGIEIAEAGWYVPSTLPNPHRPAVSLLLQMAGIQ